MEFAATRDEDLGGVVEKPGEKVGGDVEKGGEDGDEREVGEAGTEVATGKKHEADASGEGVGIFWFGFMPVEAGDDVERECKSVKPGNEKEERGEGEGEVEDDESPGEAGEDGDWTAVTSAGEAEEMDDLGGEESDETELRGVIEGENDVGDAGREHGGEEEVVLREGFGDVEETEGDAADAKESEEVIVRREETEDDIDEKKRDPDGGPEERDVAGGSAGCIGGRGVLARMETIRSRNSCSYFTFV